MRSSAAQTLRLLAGFAAAPVAAAVISVGVYDAFWHIGWMPNGAPLHSVGAAVAFGAGVFILAVVVTGAAAVLGVTPGSTNEVGSRLASSSCLAP